MQKVKTFSHVFINSLLPHVLYYSKLLKTRFIFSLKYFLTFFLFLYLLFLILISLKYPPQLILNFKKNFLSSINTFPKDLIITINKGRMTANYDRPYFLWLSNSDKKLLLFVADETASPDKIYEYRSKILLTKTQLVVIKPSQTYDLSKLDNIIIDKNWVENLKLKIDSLMEIVFGLFIIFLITLPFFIFSLEIFYVFILSSITYLIFKFVIKKQKKIGFKKTLQLSLHSSTIPFILDTFFWDKGFDPIWIVSISFLFMVFLSGAIYEAYLDYNEASKKYHHKLTHHKKN